MRLTHNGLGQTITWLYDATGMKLQKKTSRPALSVVNTNPIPTSTTTGAAITSAGRIASGGNVTMSASQSIDLLLNFTAEQGGIFYGYIGATSTAKEYDTQDYVGGIEYRNQALEAIYHAEGRVYKNGSTWQYEYSLKDHLGNSRITFADINNNGTIAPASEILQENHYYPFGLSQEGNWLNSAALPDNKYTYNMKEWNEELGLGWLDYGARWYDPAVGRFGAVDRFTEKYSSLTPYQYGANNPMKFIDINGDSTYLVIYGSGWYRPENKGKDYDVGESFKKSAEAKAEAIRNGKGFDPESDVVEVVYAATEDAFIKATNAYYASGEIASLDVYSHGTNNSINLGGESTGLNSQQDKMWVSVSDVAEDSNNRGENEFSKINSSNFTSNSRTTLWGCNLGGRNSEESDKSPAQAIVNQLGGSSRAFVGGGGAEFKQINGRNVFDGTLIRSSDRASQKVRLTSFNSKL